MVKNIYTKLALSKKCSSFLLLQMQSVRIALSAISYLDNYFDEKHFHNDTISIDILALLNVVSILHCKGLEELHGNEQNRKKVIS